MKEKVPKTEAGKDYPLLEFEKDGKKSYFDYKDGKWQFWGDLPADESAKELFDYLGRYLDQGYYDKKTNPKTTCSQRK